MRDWEEQLKEVKMYYSCGAAAVRDMEYLKTKYNEIKEMVDVIEGKKPKIQVNMFDEKGGGDLENEDMLTHKQDHPAYTKSKFHKESDRRISPHQL